MIGESLPTTAASHAISRPLSRSEIRGTLRSHRALINSRATSPGLDAEPCPLPELYPLPEPYPLLGPCPLLEPCPLLDPFPLLKPFPLLEACPLAGPCPFAAARIGIAPPPRSFPDLFMDTCRFGG